MDKVKLDHTTSVVISHRYAELNGKCYPRYPNDTCAEERILARNWNVCTGEAEILICYPDCRHGSFYPECILTKDLCMLVVLMSLF